MYRLAYSSDVVAFKMRPGKALRAGLAVEGASRSAGQPAYFQRNPPGRGPEKEIGYGQK